MFQFRWSLLVLLIVSCVFVNTYSLSKDNKDSIFVFLNTSSDTSWSKPLRKKLGLKGYKEYPIPNLSDLNAEYRVGNIYHLNLNSKQSIADQKEEITRRLRFIRILFENESTKAHVNLLVDAESKLLTQISNEFLKKSGSHSVYSIGKFGTTISFKDGQRSRSLDSLSSSSNVTKGNGRDDWQYFRIEEQASRTKTPRKKLRVRAKRKPQFRRGLHSAPTGVFSSNMKVSAMSSSMAPTPSMGLTVGGAMSVSNFRKKIDSDVMPFPGDLSFEGLFSDYYFDTNAIQECKALFCPSYSSAVSPDPISVRKSIIFQLA